MEITRKYQHSRASRDEGMWNMLQGINKTPGKSKKKKSWKYWQKFEEGDDINMSSLPSISLC